MKQISVVRTGHGLKIDEPCVILVEGHTNTYYLQSGFQLRLLYVILTFEKGLFDFIVKQANTETHMIQFNASGSGLLEIRFDKPIIIGCLVEFQILSTALEVKFIGHVDEAEDES